MNKYFEIAEQDYLFLKEIRNSRFYNNVAIHCQQVSEKLLKAIISDTLPDKDCMIRTHNLKRLYDCVKGNIQLEHDSELFLGSFSDFYTDSGYPGPDFVQVTKEDLYLCLKITDELYSEVSNWITSSES